MVKRLNVALNDDDFQKVKSVKDDLDMTWEEFVLEATECLQDDHEP